MSYDILAWMSSWSVPAAILLGGAGDSKSPSSSKKPRVSSKRGKRNVVNIDALDNPKDVKGLMGRFATTFPVASQRTENSWQNKVRTRAAKVDLVARAKNMPPAPT